MSDPGHTLAASQSSGRRKLTTRRHLQRIVVQGVLWSAGNALTSGFLITFLALELGAGHVQVSLILALQAIVGLLRLATPLLVSWWGSKRRTTLITLGASYSTLAVLPLLPIVAGEVTLAHPVAALIIILSVHQLLEFIGFVALWSWLGELIPPRLRGRFLGQRNMLQMVCVTIVTPLSGWAIDRWQSTHPAACEKLLGYAVAIGVGAICLLASLVPLWGLRSSARPVRRNHPRATPIHQGIDWLAPWQDRRFRPLLWFIAWFSLANGLTQTAQNVFPKAILGQSLLLSNAMVTLMRIAQAGISVPVGWGSDRWGNRPILLVCQALIAVGPLFYWLASVAQPWWLWGAWVVWVAFAGHNICLPNLLLKLAPPRDNTPYLASYFAVSNLSFALSTLVGGWLLSWGEKLASSDASTWTKAQIFGSFFLAGSLLRGIGIGFLARIRE